MWDGLVAKHEGFILTLSGHVLDNGLGRVTTATPGGRAVPQLLVNYQMRPNGGDGWLRLLEFKADRKTVEVYDYSPTPKQRIESVQSRFTLTLARSGDGVPNPLHAIKSALSTSKRRGTPHGHDLAACDRVAQTCWQ